MSNIAFQLTGYRLTTAEILYHMPDHPRLLQSFVWQFMDRAPKYPKLMDFLAFWESNIDGKIHSVNVAGKQVIDAADVRMMTQTGHLH
ncbi:MAG: Usg family protein [Pseudomonadota bacterium]